MNAASLQRRRDATVELSRIGSRDPVYNSAAIAPTAAEL